MNPSARDSDSDKVEGFRLVVYGAEVGVIQRAIPLDAAEEDAARTVLLAKAELLNGGAHVAQGRHHHPANLPVRAV